MRFRYLRDPLFLCCVALYFANRLVFEPLLPGRFWCSYVNDLICIPFWVPIMLWLMRRLRLRADDAPPRAHEIIVPLLMWSAVFELWLPRTRAFARLATGDPYDILCYTAGALAATLVWQATYPRNRAPSPTSPA